MKGKQEAMARGLILPRHRAETSTPADWSKVDAGTIQEAIAAVASKGGALRFGYTRDGGAYAIGVYGSGQPYTEYVRPSENIEQYLLTVARAAWGDESPKP